MRKDYGGRGVEISIFEEWNWCHTMYVSESAVDITALQSAGSDQDVRRQGTSAFTGRPVKILPVSQLPPSSPAPGAPLKPGGRGNLFGEPGQQKTWPETLLPSLAWMRAYTWRDNLKMDAVAGITVGTMLIPQVLRLVDVL